MASQTATLTTNESTSTKMNFTSPDIDLDQQTQQQQQEIEKEIADHQPLISPKSETNDLHKEYLTEDKIYQDKITELGKKYKFIRRTRGDGNCFYRAFGFGYLEENLKNPKELERFRQLTCDLKEKLVKLGYLDFTVEDLSDVVLEIIDNIQKNPNEKTLWEYFCSASHSDYFVSYLRMFTSAYLQTNGDFFTNFIEDGKTIKEFCSSEVEPMTRESDNIHIIALSKAAGVSLSVIYMDRSEQSSLTTHDFPANDDDNTKNFKPMITMLYRPGHYDLLYEH